MESAVIIEVLRDYGVPIAAIMYYLLYLLPAREKREAQRQDTQDSYMRELLTSIQQSQDKQISMLAAAIDAQRKEVVALMDSIRQLAAKVDEITKMSK